MKNILRLGIVAQAEIPKQIEPMIETIVREQFRKLSNVLGGENVAVVSNISYKIGELACIAAIEEGLNLELSPLEAQEDYGSSEAEMDRKVHGILARQPRSFVQDHVHTEPELIDFCDVIILVFYKDDAGESKNFRELRDKFFAGGIQGPTPSRLSIEINAPKKWTMESDAEVYFEYIVPANGRLDSTSEVEIPEKLIAVWRHQVSRNIASC